MREKPAGTARVSLTVWRTKAGKKVLKMAGNFGRYLLCGLLLATAIPHWQIGAQVPASKEGVFPGDLLEGTERFDVALTLQGDLRGNYGPCG
jgi:hypothetical protein